MRLKSLRSLTHALFLRFFRLLTCREIEALTYDFLDGNLEAKLARRIERHLRACGPCHKFMNSYRKTKELGRHLERPPLDPAFKREMLKFLLSERLR